MWKYLVDIWKGRTDDVPGRTITVFRVIKKDGSWKEYRSTKSLGRAYGVCHPVVRQGLLDGTLLNLKEFAGVENVVAVRKKVK